MRKWQDENPGLTGPLRGQPPFRQKRHHSDLRGGKHLGKASFEPEKRSSGGEDKDSKKL